MIIVVCVQFVNYDISPMHTIIYMITYTIMIYTLIYTYNMVYIHTYTHSYMLTYTYIYTYICYVYYAYRVINPLYKPNKRGNRKYLIYTYM